MTQEYGGNIFIIKLFDYGSVVMPSSPDMINRVNALLSSMYSNIMLFEIDSMKNGLMKDLTFHEVHTIEIIGDLERPTMSQISRKANVTQSTMSTMVNKLAKKGMIQRHPNRNDRRVVNITLTEYTVAKSLNLAAVLFLGLVQLSIGGSWISIPM